MQNCRREFDIAHRGKLVGWLIAQDINDVHLLLLASPHPEVPS